MKQSVHAIAYKIQDEKAAYYSSQIAGQCRQTQQHRHFPVHHGDGLNGNTYYSVINRCQGEIPDDARFVHPIGLPYCRSAGTQFLCLFLEVVIQGSFFIYLIVNIDQIFDRVFNMKMVFRACRMLTG